MLRKVSIGYGAGGLFPLLTVCKEWSEIALHELYLNPFLKTEDTCVKFCNLFSIISAFSRDPRAIDKENQQSLSFSTSLVHLIVTLFSWKEKDASLLAGQIVDFSLGRILRLSPATIMKLYVYMYFFTL